mgnify:FL=1
MSANDKALWASRALSTQVRLGESTNPMLVIPGADVIDATAVPTDLLGHGYIASAAELLDDLIMLIGQRLGPPRGRLQPAGIPGSVYWKLP